MLHSNLKVSTEKFELKNNIIYHTFLFIVHITLPIHNQNKTSSQ